MIEIKLIQIQPYNECCLIIKSLFRLSLRMITSFVQSLIKLYRLNWTERFYSTIFRRQKHINIPIGYQKSSYRHPCIKLLDDKLSAKHFSNQINEAEARIVVLNEFKELGRPHN